MQLAPHDVEQLLYRVSDLEDSVAASLARIEAYRQREHALKAELAALRLASVGVGDEAAATTTAAAAAAAATAAAPPAPTPPPPPTPPPAAAPTTPTPITLLLPGRGRAPGAFVVDGDDALDFYEHVARVPRRAFLGFAPAPPVPPPPAPASTAATATPAAPSGRPAVPLLLPACLNPAPSMGAIAADDDGAVGTTAAAPYYEPISPADAADPAGGGGGSGADTKAGGALGGGGGGWAARLSGWVNLAAGGGGGAGGTPEQQQQQQQERRPGISDDSNTTARAAALAAAASAPGADEGATAVWHPMQLPSFSRQDSRVMLALQGRRGSRRGSTLSPASSAGGGLVGAAAGAAPTTTMMVPPSPVEVAVPGGGAPKGPAAAAPLSSSSSSMRLAPAWQVLWRAPAPGKAGDGGDSDDKAEDDDDDEGDPSAPPLRLAFVASAEARELLQARTAGWAGGGGGQEETGKRRNHRESNGDDGDADDQDVFELAPPRHLAPPLPPSQQDSGGDQPQPQPAPRLSEPSCVVGPESVSHPDLWLRGLAAALPGRFSRRERWTLLYSTNRDGTSLSTLLRRARGCAPTILLVRDSGGGVFGCYAPEAWRPSPRFFGSGECFVFQLCPHAVYWPWRVKGAKGGRRNDFFQLAIPSRGLSVGGGGGRAAIFLDEELLRGSSGSCATFGSPCLASSEEFDVAAVEVWHVGSGGGGGGGGVGGAERRHEFGGV